MIKFFLLLCLVWVVYSETSAEIVLTPEENVLAGVVFIEGRKDLPDSARARVYNDLLEVNSLTHEQFQNYLNKSKENIHQWNNTMTRIDSLYGSKRTRN